MNLILLILAAALMAMAAPTSPSSAARLFKAEVFDAIMEDMCLDMSEALCAGEDDGKDYGVYDPDSIGGICECSDKPSDYMLESRCPDILCPFAKPYVNFDLFRDECFCEAVDNYVDSMTELISSTSRLSSLQELMSPGIFRIEQRVGELVTTLDIWKDLGPSKHEHLQLTQMVSAVLEQLHTLRSKIRVANQEMRKQTDALTNGHKGKRQEPVSASSTSIDPAAPTFIPPPKTDITPELINQSLSDQADNTGVVTGAIPIFRDGVITFPVQLEGPVAPIIPINCSTSLPCGAIGNGPDPNILITPKYVQDGTKQTTVADCMVIAVNMYDPKVISYVIRNNAGEVYSLVGSNKIHDMDKIDTSLPIALSLQPSLTSTKRDILTGLDYVSPKFHRVHKIDCRSECTRTGSFIQGLEDYCGCMHEEDEDFSLWERSGISAPDVTEATMSAEACAAMTCINNRGQPAIFNPYSLTCWCMDEVFVEDNPSGWIGRARSLPQDRWKHSGIMSTRMTNLKPSLGRFQQDLDNQDQPGANSIP